MVEHRRVLVISYLFPPGLEMGAQACAQIARYLPAYAWTPIVLTARGDGGHVDSPPVEGIVPETVIRTPVIPHPFSVYRQLKSRLGIVAEVTLGETGQNGSVRRRGTASRWVLSMLAAPDIYTGWIPPAVVAGLQALQRHRIMHLFSSGPPWTTHLVALILARLSGLPWTAHFRDPWTGPRSEMARLKPVTALSFRFEKALERMVVRRADAVVCVTDEHAALLRRNHPGAAGKFVTIPNGFDGTEWESLAHDTRRRDSGDARSFLITYAGAFYDRRSPAPVFRALKGLINAGEIPREGVRVDLLGWCDVAQGRRVKELVTECGLDDCVCLAGPVGRRETLQRMMDADLLLLLAEGLTLQIPGKTYEYLRAGRPILALAPEGAVARLLRKTGGAWVVDPGDQSSIASALHQAYRGWTERTQRPAPDPAEVAAFDRRILAGRFAEVFKSASPR